MAKPDLDPSGDLAGPTTRGRQDDGSTVRLFVARDSGHDFRSDRRCAAGLGLHAVICGANLPGDPVASIAAGQARLIALGLPLMVLLARLIRGDADATWKIAVFGAASVAAFHLIRFGVALSMFPSPVLITMLFGISWAIHQIADALARDTGGSFVLHAISGFTAGVLVAVASQVLQRWPGGRLTAPAVHWSVIYLILGFSR